MPNQKGFANFIIILGIVILGATFLGGYLLAININRSKNTSDTTYLPTYTPPPCYTKPDPKKSSQLRQVDVKSKFLGNQDFPSGLANICDSELVRIDCIDPYTRQDDGSYTFNSTESVESVTKTISLRVTQPDILDNINRLMGKLDGKKPDSIRYCSIGKGDLIAEFDILQAGKSSNKTINYALLLAQGGVDILSSISNDGFGNFSCDKPILLTKDNQLYVQCSAENGSSNYKYIYKIDINKGITTKIFQCFSTGVNNLGENNVTCQNFLPSPTP